MLQVRDLRIEIGARVTLEGASFKLREGDKVGLVGRNGTGKTTMLKVIAGEGASAGGVVLRSDALGYLPQNPQPRGSGVDNTALSHVLSGRGLDTAAQRVEKLRLRIEENPSEKDVAKFARAEEEFRDAGGYAAESEVRAHRGRARAHATVDSTSRSTRCPVVSGAGSSSRASCSRAASCSCSTSRPTTSTTTPRSGWSGSSATYRGALLVVSHDLDLLDSSITRVLHLDDGRARRVPRHLLAVPRGPRRGRGAARTPRDAPAARRSTGCGTSPTACGARPRSGPRPRSRSTPGSASSQKGRVTGPEAREAHRGEVPRPAARRPRRPRPSTGSPRATAAHRCSRTSSSASTAVSDSSSWASTARARRASCASSPATRPRRRGHRGPRPRRLRRLLRAGARRHHRRAARCSAC